MITNDRKKKYTIKIEKTRGATWQKEILTLTKLQTEEIQTA